MTKQQFSSILEKLEETYSQDTHEVKAWNDFIKVLMPTEYAPIPEWKLSTVIDILKLEHPWIAELMEYYFYESKNMAWWWTIECDWKKYNYSKKEEVIQSLIDFWHIS